MEILARFVHGVRGHVAPFMRNKDIAMRIIASKPIPQGSTAWVVLSGHHIHLLETIKGITPQSLRCPSIVFRRTFIGGRVWGSEHKHSKRRLRMRAGYVGAISALRRHH
ncbi:hypothetical protein ACQUQQ_08435 [Acidithiobacillus ferrooxidans]|uniref:hypothetical protein n=1 Tax=Acidithiobacillus ferrooxidans TaxID=920 RepID=UPI000ADCC49B